MWCRFGTAIAAVTFGLASSIVTYQVAFAVRSRDYSPREFRAILHGFGYNVTPGDTLTDEETRKAIRELQQGYKLAKVDGTANSETQDFVSDVVKVLQGNLNLVIKPNPPLPRNQFYGPRTEAAVTQYQKQFNLPENGIANLALRQKLDVEAKKILGSGSTPQPSPTPSPSPRSAPSPSPTASPSPRSTTSPRSRPTVTPSPQTTTSPRSRPTVTPSPQTTPTPSPSFSPTPRSNP